MPSTITTTGQRRKKSGATRTGEGGIPGWMWMLLGMALGLVIAVLIYLLQHTAPEQTHEAETETPVKTETDSEAATETKPPEEEAIAEPVPEVEVEQERRRFDFYNLLPDMEVVIPERKQPVAPDDTPTRETIPEPDPGTRYIMQAGSFQSFAEADRLKASLALLGVESHIEQVTIDDGSRWHRVRIGPIDDFERMQATRERLADNDIEVMLIRLRE